MNNSIGDEKCTVAHRNGLFTYHTRESNLNRFITKPRWNELEMVSKYAWRWDIKVWHREGKGSYGLEDCAGYLLSLLFSLSRAASKSTIQGVTITFSGRKHDRHRDSEGSNTWLSNNTTMVLCSE